MGKYGMAINVYVPMVLLRHLSTAVVSSVLLIKLHCQVGHVYVEMGRRKIIMGFVLIFVILGWLIVKVNVGLLVERERNGQDITVFVSLGIKELRLMCACLLVLLMSKEEVINANANLDIKKLPKDVFYQETVHPHINGSTATASALQATRKTKQALAFQSANQAISAIAKASAF